MGLISLCKATSKKRLIIFGFLASILAGYFVIFIGLGFYGFPHQPRFNLKENDKEIRVLGSKIRYRDIKGEGVPIIFIHGNNLSLDDWDATISHFEGQRMIALDLIGFAGSDRPDLPYDIECHQRYILKFMDALGIPEAVLVGHSMGGTIAAWTAAKSNERIQGVVMISLPGVPGSLIYAWPKSLICRAGVLNKLTFWIANSSLFKYAFPLSLARQTLGVTGSYGPVFAEALDDIHQPALLLMAPNDERTPIEFSQVYQEKIETLDFSKLPPEAGHMAPRTYPQGLASLMMDFLDDYEMVGP
ncbi:alpha/beta fold hydrolase [Thermodesulfobacteriota bacterium]